MTATQIAIVIATLSTLGAGITWDLGWIGTSFSLMAIALFSWIAPAMVSS